MEWTSLYKKLDRGMPKVLVEIQERIKKLGLDEMLEFLVNQIIKTLKIARCSIFRVFPESEKVFLMAGEPKDEHGLGMEFRFQDLKAIKEVVAAKSCLLIEEPLQDERTKQSRGLICCKGINAILFVPLVAGSEVIGVIVLDATGSRTTFSQKEIHFCMVLGDLVGLVLKRNMKVR